MVIFKASKSAFYFLDDTLVGGLFNSRLAFNGTSHILALNDKILKNGREDLAPRELPLVLAWYQRCT